MSLPFVLVIAASILALGWASLHKSSVAITARMTTWQKRDTRKLENLQQARDRLPLSGITLNTPLSGEIYPEPTRQQFSLPSWMGGSAVATSGNMVLIGSWDYYEVDFGGDRPHFGVLSKMGAGSMLGGIKGLESLLK
jgi:hypothetical protein